MRAQTFFNSRAATLLRCLSTAVTIFSTHAAPPKQSTGTETQAAKAQEAVSIRQTNAPKEDLGYFPPPESEGGWRKLDTPEDVRRIGGMDPGKLAGLKQWLLDSDNRDFAAVVVRHGYIVLEVERGNSAKTDSRRVASVSKAICATVLAIASEQSQRGPTPRKMKFDDPAFPFIPWAYPLSDPRKEKINAQTFSHAWELPARLTGEGGRRGDGIPADARDKPGSGGQLIAWVPSLDLVVTRQTGSSGEWAFEEYLRRACDAAIRAVPATTIP